MLAFILIFAFNTNADVFSLLSGRVDGKLKVDVGVEKEISSRGKDHKLETIEVSKSIKAKSSNSYYLYARYKNFQFRPTKLFYDSKSVSLDQLESAKLGFGYRNTDYGAFIDFGSEGDKLFSGDSQTISVTGFSEYNSWVYFLNYSNNRTFLNHWPLPGLAYKWRSEDKKWNMYIGAPFFFASWNPITPLIFSYFTLLPYTHKLSAMYMIQFVRVFAGINTGPKSFVASFLDPDDARIYYDEKTAYIGIAVPFSRRGAFVLRFDRSFSQKLSLSKSYQNLYSNEVRFSDASKASLHLKLNF
ncbi:MAG: hypothetical protein MK008_02295 [Bdellovibrionales bacterium]|nr:hypothetical protein [Bdellovibrionales bacterium]